MYYFGRAVFRIIFSLTGGLKSIGEENIPSDGGVILAPNHISYADPPAVGSAMKRQVHFMAKEELFKPAIMGYIISAVGSFPVKRGTADRKAIKQALDLLRKGEVVCIFPEGTRSLDGNLQKAEPGIGLIALKSGCPVVPVAVAGTNKVLPSDKKERQRHLITIEYGKPIKFDDLQNETDSSKAKEEVGNRIMSAIDLLMRKERL